MPHPNKMNYCPQCGKALIMASHGGMDRKACPDKQCGYVHWNNPTPVVAAIVERNGHVVLVRSIGWPEGWFGLVTGFLEAGETTDEAVVREVKEEIGLDAELMEFIGVYPFFRMNQLILAYHLKAPDGEIRLDTTELEGYKEVPIDKVMPWASGTGYALRDWLRSKGIEKEPIPLGARRS